jgi:hypothetical protein
MYKVEDCVFLEFDFDHMAASEFSALRKRVYQCFIKIQHQGLLGRLRGYQWTRNELRRSF